MTFDIVHVRYRHTISTRNVNFFDIDVISISKTSIPNITFDIVRPTLDIGVPRFQMIILEFKLLQLNALAGTAEQGFGFSKAISSSLPRQDDDTILQSSNPSHLLPPRSALQSASLHPCAHDEVGCRRKLALDAPIADRASAAYPSAYIGVPSDARI